jgi:ABC-type glycerol-3-phosphate transport system permease component
MATSIPREAGASVSPHRSRQASLWTSRPVLAVRRRLIWIPLLALALWTIIPVFVAISISLKAPAEVFGSGTILPADPSLEAYRRTLGRDGFQTALVNSILVAVGSLSITVVLAVPAAYAFARFAFRARHLLLILILLPRLVPTLGLLVPLYKLAAFLGVLDSRITLMVAFAGTGLPLAVWLLTGFFRQIPVGIEEAAAIDGASLWQRLRYIVIPLSYPALITIGALAFREAWNEFDLVLALTTTAESRTLPYELFLHSNVTGVPDYPVEAAFALLTIIPLLLVYLRLERYVVSGITSGAIK